MRRGLINGRRSRSGADRAWDTEAEEEPEAATETEQEAEIEVGNGNGIRNWNKEYIAFRTKKRKRK